MVASPPGLQGMGEPSQVALRWGYVLSQLHPVGGDREVGMSWGRRKEMRRGGRRGGGGGTLVRRKTKRHRDRVMKMKTEGKRGREI